MRTSSREILRRLGAGETIESLRRSEGWSQADFDEWRRREFERRDPARVGEVRCGVRGYVTIARDSWGIPHISAQRQDDLWFGFGYAIAQDRLFQLDYLRRKGLGRLSEILGPDGLALDLIARTVGLNRIAREELDRIPDETRSFLEAFSSGVNAWIHECRDAPPIEFDLLDYRPEPWSPLDSLAIESEFRWYLTGRFPVIVMPELGKRVLGEGSLYQDFLLGEADEEAIIPPEAYANIRRDPNDLLWRDLPARPRESVGQSTGDAEGTGSNNWVVSGKLTASGFPMVASDPHIAFEAVSCWYEVHLSGAGFDVAGMSYVGIPAVMFGRNQRVAWGITNNICSLRDLYQERTDPGHPGCYLHAGKWEPAREITEVIHVKGIEPISRTVKFSRNGPIVDEILPAPANETGPVSLKWLGALRGGWLTALLAMDRARNVSEFREALRPWHVPTFNLVIADVEGHIAVQSAGRIPLRALPERGYRPGWDPNHQWLGLLPFEFMPHAVDPSRGWLATANNRLVADDYPYPVYGTWSAGYRAVRIREMIEERLSKTGGPRGFDFDAFRDMHQDAKSLRAEACVPPLIKALSGVDSAPVQTALGFLRDWNYHVEADFVAPLIFNVFFANWSRAVSFARFEGKAAELLAKQSEGVASRLLSEDRLGWFKPDEREATLRRVFMETLEDLSKRFGPDMNEWRWGRLHRIPLKHVLSNRGDLSALLDHGGGPVKGDMVTVCNTGSGPDFLAASGANYRLVADLAVAGLWAVDSQSQSGNPGTPHYSDQLEEWAGGRYHFLPLDPDRVSEIAAERLTLRPTS